jgi:hypothetical protein
MQESPMVLIFSTPVPRQDGRRRKNLAQKVDHAVRRQSLTERREPDQIAKQDSRFHYPIGNHRLAIA